MSGLIEGFFGYINDYFCGMKFLGNVVFRSLEKWHRYQDQDYKNDNLPSHDNLTFFDSRQKLRRFSKLLPKATGRALERPPSQYTTSFS